MHCQATELDHKATVPQGLHGHYQQAPHPLFIKKLPQHLLWRLSEILPASEAHSADSAHKVAANMHQPRNPPSHLDSQPTLTGRQPFFTNKASSIRHSMGVAEENKNAKWMELRATCNYWNGIEPGIYRESIGNQTVVRAPILNLYQGAPLLTHRHASLHIKVIPLDWWRTVVCW